MTCHSTEETATATIVAKPNAPNIAKSNNVCQGASAMTFTASGGSGTIDIYDYTTGTGASLSGNTVTYSTSASTGTKTVKAHSYVTSGTLTCYSATTATASATVVAIPNPPTITRSSSTVCEGGTALTFTASNYTGTLKWTSYTTGTGASQSGNIVTYSTSAAAGTKTVYAYSSYTDGVTCYSAERSNSATISPKPKAPKLSSTGSVCAGGSIQFTASDYSGTLDWTGSSSGYSSGTDYIYYSNVSSGKSATVKSYIGNCYSASTSTSVSIGSAPAAPSSVTTNNQFSNVCEGASITWTATGGTNVRWYGACSGSGNSCSISNVTAGTKTAYAYSVGTGGCESGARSASVSVVAPPPTPSISWSGSTCVGKSITFTLNGTTGTGVIAALDGYCSSSARTCTVTNTTAGSKYMRGRYMNDATKPCVSETASINVTITECP
jgi:hypothetical protein